MSVQFTVKANHRIEVAVGKVTPGREGYMYGEYFPAARPLMDRAGVQSLSSFVVVASNRPGVEPVQGAFSSWPAADNRRRLFDDPQFQKLVVERDAALDLLSDGHLFEGVDHTVDVSTDQEYALIIAQDLTPDPAAALHLQFAADSPEREHAGKTVTLQPWSDAADRLISGPSTQAEVHRIRFNAPSA